MKQNIFDQLVAMGHEPRVIRNRVFLGSMNVDVIVDSVPISFTRRRYGKATFCWAEAYVGGWFSLDNGSPWQKVTPSLTDIRRELARLQEEQFLRESGTANPAR